MAILKKQTPKKNSAPKGGLNMGHMIGLLNQAQNFVNGLPVTVPMLAFAFEVASGILQMIQVLTSNREGCESLARRIVEIMGEISYRLQCCNKEDIPPDLIANCTKFATTLDEIKSGLEPLLAQSQPLKVSKWKKIKQLFQTDEIADGIKEANRKLDDAIEDFQIANDLSTTLAISRLEAKLQVILKLQSSKVTVTVGVTLPPASTTTIPTEPKLVGRDKLVDETIERILAEESTRLALVGAGGMGKTSLAQFICHRPRISGTFGARIYWISCEAVTSFESFVDAIAKGVQVVKVTSNLLDDISNVLCGNNSRAFIVLDNLETAINRADQQSEVENVLSVLFAVPRLAILVTLRGTLPGGNLDWTKPYLPNLGPLDIPAARQLWLRSQPQPFIDPDLDTLLDAIGGMPLAVTLIAKRAADSGESAKELLGEWNDVGTDIVPGQDPRHSITTSIKLSLESCHIKSCPGAVTLLRVLSQLPGGTRHENLKQLVPSLPDVGGAYLALIRSSLVYLLPDSKTIRVFPPVARYSVKNQALDPKVEEDIRQFYYQYINVLHFPAPGKPSFSTEAMAIGVEETNLEVVFLDVLKIDPPSMVPEKALDAAWFFCRYQQNTSPKLTIINALVAFARSNPSSGLLGLHLSNRGEMYRMMNMYDDARTCQQEARQECLQEGDKDNAALALQRQGKAAFMLLNLDEAKKCLRDSRAELIANYNIENKGWRMAWAAMSLRGLADVDLLENSCAEARIKYQDAYNEFVGAKWESHATRCLRGLGDVHRLLNEHPEARKKLQDARTELLSIRDRPGSTGCLQSLGEIDRMLSQWNEAQAKLQQARDEFLNLKNLRSASQCLRSLGNIHCHLGQGDQARREIQEARDGFERIGDRLGSVQCIQSLAEVDVMENAYDKARTTLEEARDGFIGINESRGVAQCLRSLGDIDTEQLQYDDARKKIQTAKDAFVRMGASLDAARCTRSLGRIECALGMYDDAKKLLQDSRNEFIRVGDRRGAARTVQVLGHVDSKCQEKEEARMKFQQALEEFGAIGDSRSAALCSRDLEQLDGKAISCPASYRFTEPTQFVNLSY